MKTGGFGYLSDYSKMQAAGFDYAELDLPELEKLSENQYEHFRRSILQKEFPVLTGARLFPITDPIFMAEGFDPESLREYTVHTCERAAGVGIQKIIMGNGKARSYTGELDPKREEIFISFLQMISDIASDHSLEFILEPLGPEYSNYINTIPEAVELIKRVQRNNIFTMADLRHMVRGNESFDDLISCREYIHHIHVDFPLTYPERRYPSVDDGYDYQPFLKALSESGYHDTMTIEADVPSDWKSACHQFQQTFRLNVHP